MHTIDRPMLLLAVALLCATVSAVTYSGTPCLRVSDTMPAFCCATALGMALHSVGVTCASCSLRVLHVALHPPATNSTQRVRLFVRACCRRRLGVSSRSSTASSSVFVIACAVFCCRFAATVEHTRTIPPTRSRPRPSRPASLCTCRNCHPDSSSCVSTLLALLLLLQRYGSCTAGACGTFSYYYRTGGISCGCSKPVGAPSLCSLLGFPVIRSPSHARR